MAKEPTGLHYSLGRIQNAGKGAHHLGLGMTEGKKPNIKCLYLKKSGRSQSSAGMAAPDTPWTQAPSPSVLACWPMVSIPKVTSWMKTAAEASFIISTF